MADRIVGIITETGKVTTRREPIPAPGDGEALVQVAVSLISPGTEMNDVKERRSGRSAGGRRTGGPNPFGYAVAGEIMEPPAGSSTLSKGMRVAAMGAGYALHTNIACVPVNLIVGLPEAVSFSQGVYACLGATAIQCVRRTEARLGEYGVVVGMGIVGNLIAQLGRESGSRIIGWESLPNRRKIAAACGITLSLSPGEGDPVEETRLFSQPHGLDFAVFAFGGEASDTLSKVVKCMKLSADGHRMGRITLVGGCNVSVRGGSSMGNLDIRASSRTGPGYHDPSYERGQTYPAGFVPFDTRRNLEEVVRLIEEKRLLVDPMTTHRIPLDEIGGAAELLIDRPNEALGVILEMR
jgi:threonine dehydrogenase-like Zn-dependent dehydrogenase